MIYEFRDIHNIGFEEQFVKKPLRTIVLRTLNLVPYRKKNIKIMKKINISMDISRGTLKFIKKFILISFEFLINF